VIGYECVDKIQLRKGTVKYGAFINRVVNMWFL
jgi:hypothetical protein